MIDPRTGQSIPPENYQTVFEWVRGERELEDATGWTLSGSIVSFTYNLGPRIDDIYFGGPVDYPGFGGPDITVDIVLDEYGRPQGVTVIVDVPPGFPTPQVRYLARL